MANKAAYEIPSFYFGILEANLDLSTEATYQYTAVDVGAASGAGVTGPAALIAPLGAGKKVIGILQNNPQLAEVGQVMVHGVSKALYGGNVAIGDVLATAASGKLVKATTGDFGVAIALTAGADTQIGSALLMSLGVQP